MGINRCHDGPSELIKGANSGTVPFSKTWHSAKDIYWNQQQQERHHKMAWLKDQTKARVIWLGAYYIQQAWGQNTGLLHCSMQCTSKIAYPTQLPTIHRIEYTLDTNPPQNTSGYLAVLSSHANQDQEWQNWTTTQSPVDSWDKPRQIRTCITAMIKPSA
jgi:hypothetical protein